MHRAAVMLSGEFELRAGVFGTDQARGRAFAERIGVAAGRSYADLEEMLAGESRRAPGERIEVVSVLTPNHLHFPMVDRLLDAGLHVFCEKPLSLSVVEALALERKAVTRGCQVGVAHTYTGYPMVRQMRALIAGGAIGAVQKIDVQYYQGLDQSRDARRGTARRGVASRSRTLRAQLLHRRYRRTCFRSG
ncbi:MAG: Gfo/Idh/MocA family oxidoreductase [Gammaproteobacteria bacterium]|nr:Gfo/Idh/MocA family oxidoreductase [Gammaproteobacteria bacterium]